MTGGIAVVLAGPDTDNKELLAPAVRTLFPDLVGFIHEDDENQLRPGILYTTNYYSAAKEHGSDVQVILITTAMSLGEVAEIARTVRNGQAGLE